MGEKIIYFISSVTWTANHHCSHTLPKCFRFMSLHCSQQCPIFTEGRDLHDCSGGNQPEVSTVLLLGVAFSTLRKDGSLRDALASAEGRCLPRPRPSPTRMPSSGEATEKPAVQTFASTVTRQMGRLPDSRAWKSTQRAIIPAENMK